MKGRWKEWSEQFGLVFDDHISASAKSKRAKASSSTNLELESCDTEAWCSSVALTLILQGIANTWSLLYESFC
eukprot:4367704-Amphidinium_carterae.1